MKKIVKLTESDLTRIVKRILRESENCPSKIEVSKLTQMARTACIRGELKQSETDTKGKGVHWEGMGPSCVKVGTKSMYPKTHAALMAADTEGCAELVNGKLELYKSYDGWMTLFGKDCGDKIITIPKVTPSVTNWFKNLTEDDLFKTWIVEGNDIYLFATGGC
jgi:hypothetical protein